MNRRIAKMGFLAGLISMVIMVVFAKWGYVNPELTVANVYGANAFWNFTFLEMFGGTFMIWFILWGIIYKVAGKLKEPLNSQGN